jgi:hypothetical protein
LTKRPVFAFLCAVGLVSASSACGRPLACPNGQQLGAAAHSTAALAGDPLRRAHAHNDYEHARPLRDALAMGFCSVEADIWLRRGRIIVSHLGWTSRGTLEALYLDPLQAIVARRGSVCASGPFTLWLDIKDDDPELRKALRELLARFPMLATATSPTADRPVRVVLTGDEQMKTRFVSEAPPCPIWRDSNDFAPDDPPDDGSWRFYALDWSRYVGWDGEGAIDDEDRARLECIVSGAHAAGRAVRFYDTPETPGFWRLALDVGVDFIGTDDLGALAAFLREQRP